MGGYGKFLIQSRDLHGIGVFSIRFLILHILGRICCHGFLHGPQPQVIVPGSCQGKGHFHDPVFHLQRYVFPAFIILHQIKHSVIGICRNHILPIRKHRFWCGFLPRTRKQVGFSQRETDL